MKGLSHLHSLSNISIYRRIEYPLSNRTLSKWVRNVISTSVVVRPFIISYNEVTREVHTWMTLINHPHSHPHPLSLLHFSYSVWQLFLYLRMSYPISIPWSVTIIFLLLPSIYLSLFSPLLISLICVDWIFLIINFVFFPLDSSSMSRVSIVF